MLQVKIENIGEMSVIACQGRLVRSEAAFKLRKAVLSQDHARVVVVDLSDVTAVEGGGLGMLWYLQSWAEGHAVQLKLFGPTASVKDRLAHTSPQAHFDVASLQEMMALLSEQEDAIYMAASAPTPLHRVA